MTGSPPAAAVRSTISRLARLVLADVLDRTRQPTYLVSLLAMLWVGQHMLPPLGAPYRTMTLDLFYRPAYNAAWVGTLTAVLTGVWFVLIGFYQVKGSVERDRRTGVGQILAATRVGTLTYLWVRTLGNFAVFASQAAMVILAALFQQQVLGEDRRVDLVATALPFVLFAGPMALFASAAAVFFDCVRWLRGGLGNIAWFFLFGILMVGSGMDDPRASAWRDPTGASVLVEDVRRVLIGTDPAAANRPKSLSMGVNFGERYRGHSLRTFTWPGMRWTPLQMATRLPWIALSALFVFAGALVFDRFSAAPRAQASSGSRSWWPRAAAPAPIAPRSVSVAGLTPARRGFAAFGVVRAEFALLLKGVSRWWVVGLLGLGVAQVAAPLQGVREVVLPLASFWPALVWSGMGHREQREAMDGVMFSCPRPVERLLPAAWLAGALLMLLAGAPALLRLGSAGDWLAVAGWLGGAAFVPALALCCGVWTAGGKLFEVLYLFLWYMGPMQRLPWLDYTGVTVPRPEPTWLLYGALTVSLASLAWIGRVRQARA